MADLEKTVCVWCEKEFEYNFDDLIDYEDLSSNIDEDYVYFSEIFCPLCEKWTRVD